MDGFQAPCAGTAAPTRPGAPQVTTGKATATSPLTGTVVDGVLDDDTDVAVPVVDVVPRSEEPQPASTVSPSAVNAGMSRAWVGRDRREWAGSRVTSPTISHGARAGG